MSSMRPTSAKIIQHATGLGAPSAELVRERATEIARIDGREKHTDEDWREANRELHGGHENSGANGDAEMSGLYSEHDGVMGSVGHHTENLLPEDTANVLEELVAEGMDEAVHEQMLAARQEEDTDES